MTERGSLDALFWKALLVAGGLWLLYLCLDIVLLTLLAIVIAAALLPLADAMQKRRIPRAVTVLGVYGIGLGILTILVLLLVPVVSDQAQVLSHQIPAFRDRMNGLIATIRATLGRFTGGRGQLELPSIGPEQIAPIVQDILERSLLATRRLFTGFGASLIVLFVSGYVVIDWRRMTGGLLRFVPKPHRERTSQVAAVVLRRMGGYIRGQIIVSACVATIISIGLALVGFQAPLLVGVLAGALNFVPYLGSTVSFLIAVLLALNETPFTLVGVVVVFAVEQFLEGNLLVPYFTGRQVELHPLAVLAALIVGANLAGFLGAIVAVPLAAGIDAIVQETYIKPLERRHAG
jgi:predicted PurR-regulated permease PerM